MHCFYFRPELPFAEDFPFMSNIIFILQANAPLTKLSAAVVEWPSNSDHMGIWLTTGQVLYGNFLIDLKSGRKTSQVKYKLREDYQGIFKAVWQ